MPTIILGVVGMALEITLLVILIRRRLYRRFPVFLSYCVWTVCVTVIRLSLSNHPVAFFLTFWLTEASYLVLALMVMLSLLQPFLIEAYRRHPCARYILPSAIVLIIGTSLWAVFFKPIATDVLARFVSAIYVFVPLICLVEVSLFLLAIVSTTRYGVEWTRYETGILAGFGILAFMTMLARVPALIALFHFRVGPQLEGLFRYFPSGAFISSAFAWLIAFWRPETPTKYEPPTPPHKYRELTRLRKQGLEALRELAKRLGFDLENTAAAPL